LNAEEQKEMLNLLHRLRQAMIHLTQAHVHATAALGAGVHDYRLAISELLQNAQSIEEHVTTAVGPIERHPRFPCHDPLCPVHGATTLPAATETTPERS
jgi:hypothetical protein